ncbi:hypothetical protein QYE76_019302 [Lolium multiflorum]|uniref:Uncharacterized protein n=1 Tax=Lolium multiflorum TaxID=4521 RepID=A0AAD8R2P6_LOLMU|nr:hypothetical protein QYE76_019302 [Lolium multiflorum]
MDTAVIRVALGVAAYMRVTVAPHEKLVGSWAHRIRAHNLTKVINILRWLIPPFYFPLRLPSFAFLATEALERSCRRRSSSSTEAAIAPAPPPSASPLPRRKPAPAPLEQDLLPPLVSTGPVHSTPIPPSNSMDPEDQDIVAMEVQDEEMEGGADLYTYGRWEGSNITPAEIDWLYKSRRIPVEGVECRLPVDEIKPKPKPGEYVVFTVHFMCGLGLPASAFFRSFLDRLNWNYNPKLSHKENNRICEYIEGLRETDEPSADDILRMFITHRVLPLQRRCHKICEMSGLMDPTRITTFKLTKLEVVLKVQAIAQTKMTEDWEWVLEPFSRANPPPENFNCQKLEAPASYTADRTELDEEDPNSVQNTPWTRWTTTSTPVSVYDPVPNSYAYSVNPASADPDAQVLEDTVSLAAQKTAAPKTTRGSKRASPLDSGPIAPPASKRRKVGCQGLPGAKNRSRAPLTSYGAALEINRSARGRTPSAPKTAPTPPPEPEPKLQMPNPAKGKAPTDQFPLPGFGAGRLCFGPAGPETTGFTFASTGIAKAGKISCDPITIKVSDSTAKIRDSSLLVTVKHTSVGNPKRKV